MKKIKNILSQASTQKDFNARKNDTTWANEINLD